MKARIRRAVLFALLVAMTLLAYLPALRGGFIWNDSDYVTRPELRGWVGLRRIWCEVGAVQQYYPLLHTAFWAENRLWGDSPFWYHLANVLLHGLAAGMLFLALRRWSINGAWWAAAIFALHPLAVESVAWISEEKNTLSAVFAFAAALAYGEYEQSRRARAYGLALLCFISAILSKSVTATLPATLLVLVWWRRGSIDVRRDAWPLVPFIAVGAAVGLFTGWVERVHVGAAGPDFALSLLQRLLLAAHIPWFYAAKVLWPTDLIFIYPRWNVSARDPHAWLWLMATSGALVLVISEARKKSGARGPAAACIVYLVTLFPVLGFFNVFAFIFSFVCDHWAYLAELAIIVPACAGAAAMAKASAQGRLGLTAAGATALVLFGALTWRQCRIYADNQTLYEATIARNPGCWMAHNNLGAEWSGIPGRRADAMAEFEETLRLRPEYAEAHNNLGQLLADDPGSQGAAVAQFRAAIALKPDLPEAHFFLAKLLGASPSDADAAISEYAAALRLNTLQVPDAAQAHNNLALLLCQTGRAPEARAHFEEAIRIEPEYAIARFNLAELLAQTPGRDSDAANQFEAFLRLSPNDAAARNDFGVVLARLGRMPEAIAQFEAAVRIDPKSAAYGRNLDSARASDQAR